MAKKTAAKTEVTSGVEAQTNAVPQGMETVESKPETETEVGAEAQTKRIKEHAAANRIVAESLIPDIQDAKESAKTLLSDSKKILENVRSSQIELQRIALGILKHVAQHGDIMILRHFFTQIDTVSRDWANQMKMWFDLFGTVSFDDKGEVHFNRAKPIKLGFALDKPWWNARVQKPYAGYVFTDKLNTLYEQAKKKYEKGVDEKQGDDLTYAQLEMFRKFIVELEMAEANQTEESEQAEVSTTEQPETLEQDKAA